MPRAPSFLRVTVDVPMPADDFARAEAIASVKPLIEQLREGWASLGATVEHQFIVPRKPRSERTSD